MRGGGGVLTFGSITTSNFSDYILFWVNMCYMLSLSESVDGSRQPIFWLRRKYLLVILQAFLL